MKEYVAALILETRAAFGRVSEAVTDTVYFGGGTPSLMSPEDIAAILSAVSDGAPYSPEEITLECNPDPNTDFSAYRDAGVNRISMGVQSLNDGVLVSAGRRHTASDALKAVSKACEAFENVSVDLMLGLPGQSVSDVVSDVRTLAPSVKHFSAYMLKLEKGTKLFRSVSDKTVLLPSEDETADMYDACMAEMDKFGIQRYEISNFSREGYASKHNLKYWMRDEYLGLGAAAHGFQDGYRYHNPASVSRYVSGENFGAGRTVNEYVSLADAMEEAIMLALRTDEGLDTDRFNAEFGADFFSDYRDEIAALASLTERDGSFFRIKRDKMLFESFVAREFMK